MKLKQIHKTLIVTLVLSLIVIIAAALIQINAQNQLVIRCSYIDPIIIDFLAFSAGLFLVIEGLARIYEHKPASFKRQLTRMIRIALGFAILTLHIMQFIHK